MIFGSLDFKNGCHGNKLGWWIRSDKLGIYVFISIIYTQAARMIF